MYSNSGIFYAVVLFALAFGLYYWHGRRDDRQMEKIQDFMKEDFEKKNHGENKRPGNG